MHRLGASVLGLASLYELASLLVKTLPAVVAYLEGPEQRVQAMLESSAAIIGWYALAILAVGLFVSLWDDGGMLVLAGLGLGVYEFLHRGGFLSLPSSTLEVFAWVLVSVVATLSCTILVVFPGHPSNFWRFVHQLW